MFSTPFAWLLFSLAVVGLLAADFAIFRGRSHVSLRRAGLWSAIWLAIGLLFGALLWVTDGGDVGEAYIAGYLLERSLSVDNVFVFALIFAAFGVPAAAQQRALTLGIVGAILARVVFIAAGVALIHMFHWLIFVLGALLIFTGVNMARRQEEKLDPERNLALRLLRRLMPLTPSFHGERLTVHENGRRIATPMLAVVVVLASTDVLFALDSIPAIFAITTEPVIVLTSNVCAMLGLRATYLLLAGMIERFVYLKQGLAAILVLAGAKMLVGDWIEVPVWTSLVAIAIILAIAVVASVRSPGAHEPAST
ncbi:MAG: tellurite resistance protein TerC [Chloroflexota bacterium]|nr:tellurite resistance protein TerC [Chloroflexota bacterium]